MMTKAKRKLTKKKENNWQARILYEAKISTSMYCKQNCNKDMLRDFFRQKEKWSNMEPENAKMTDVI